MLPSKNLFNPRERRLNYMPIREYLMGLYLATRKPTRKPVRIFKTRKEAAAAFRDGKIDLNDPIKVQDME